MSYVGNRCRRETKVRLVARLREPHAARSAIPLRAVSPGSIILIHLAGLRLRVWWSAPFVERSSSRYIPRHKRHLRSGHVIHARHFSSRGHRENLDRYFGLISVNPNWFADSVGKTVDSVEIWKYNARGEREEHESRYECLWEVSGFETVCTNMTLLSRGKKRKKKKELDVLGQVEIWFWYFWNNSERMCSEIIWIVLNIFREQVKFEWI